MDGGVLVFADLSSGELDDAGKGILAEGRRLAATLGCPWGAACFAGAPGEPFDAFQPYGVPQVWEIRSDPSDLSDGSALSDYPLAQAEALAEAARAVGAKVVLLAHTDLGSALAPTLADRLGGALFTETVSFGTDWAGLTVRRHALGAQVVEQRIWNGAAPLVLTVSPRVLSPVVLPSMAPGAAVRVPRTVSVGTRGRGARVVERIPPDPQTVDVAEADVIFCAGKGCDRAAFEALCELARLVGGSVGVTRPVYDQGFAGFERMIGQTGKTVVPRFYLGLGISGSMHHVGGIKDSKRIVTLNIDPKAPMFPNADEGFVADAGEVLPLLLARVRERAKGKGAP
jgi:electron transfer flavoprotein alpha subunit